MSISYTVVKYVQNRLQKSTFIVTWCCKTQFAKLMTLHVQKDNLHSQIASNKSLIQTLVISHIVLKSPSRKQTVLQKWQILVFVIEGK